MNRTLITRLYNEEKALWDKEGTEWRTYDRYILMEELAMFEREPQTLDMIELIKLWRKRLNGVS